MCGIPQGFQQVVVAGDSAAVFRWTRALSRQAYGIPALRFEREHFLNENSMIPIVAEVVGVGEAGPGAFKHLEELNSPFVARRRSAEVVGERISRAVMRPASPK